MLHIDCCSKRAAAANGQQLKIVWGQVSNGPADCGPPQPYPRTQGQVTSCAMLLAFFPELTSVLSSDQPRLPEMPPPPTEPAPFYQAGQQFPQPQNPYSTPQRTRVAQIHPRPQVQKKRKRQWDDDTQSKRQWKASEGKQRQFLKSTTGSSALTGPKAGLEVILKCRGRLNVPNAPNLVA